MQIHLVRLECTQGNSNKFYEMRAPVGGGGGSFLASYGRIGTCGTSTQYPMSKWQTKYNEKLKKGYVVVRDEIVYVTNGATPAAAANGNSGRANTAPANTAKYSFTGETKVINGQTVYRIMSNIEFVRADGKIVKPGDSGGWIANSDCLASSAESHAWVGGEAIVSDRSKVVGDALVEDEARIIGSVYISERAQVRGCSRIVSPIIPLYYCRVSGDAVVAGRASIKGAVQITDRVVVDGNAMVDGDIRICDDVWLTDNANVKWRNPGTKTLSGDAVYSGPFEL